LVEKLTQEAETRIFTLFFWKKSKATIIGKLAFASLDIEGKMSQFERQNRGIPMIPRQLKTCDNINSGASSEPVE
jgi:hypothetical protein